MNQTEALRQIRELGVQSFETRDISALLRTSPANASVILSRLGSRGLVKRIARGRWSTGGPSERERLAEAIAAPLPAYVSLQSALYRHGIIEQIPEVIYAVTLGRARVVRSPLGVVSFHRMPPALFGGFETAKNGSKIATSEKALFDFVYLSPARSRRFASLPETAFPRAFRWKEVMSWTDKIVGKSRQIHVRRKLLALRQAQSRIRSEKKTRISPVASDRGP
jgi:hypothetical protein